MNEMSNALPAVTFESEQLKAKLEKLRLEFLELFTRHKDMVENQSVILTSVYLEKLGRFQLTLLRKQTEAARLKLKMSMIQAAINRDEQPDLFNIEKQVMRQMQDYYAEIEAQAAALDTASKVLSNLLSEEETKKLKEIFRVLCKRLHPDLNPDQPENEKDLFIKAKAAYELQRLADLQNILLYLDDSAKENPELITDDEKKERVQQLGKNIFSLQEKIKLLQQNFPFTMEKLIFDEDYISRERAEIEIQIQTAETEIKKYSNIINIMCDE